MLNKKALAATAGGAEPIFIEDVFSCTLYTGNGSTQTITNGIDLSGEGGLVWGKDRGDTVTHQLVDTVRGGNKSLSSANTNAQGTNPSPYILTFNNNGYESSLLNNENLHNFVSWTFRKAEKFFDVVTYTGNGASSRNISHNLGSVPGCIIVKCTSAGSTNWIVWHRAFTSGQNLELNTTGGGPYANAYFSPLPTSTQFTLSSVGSGGFDDNTNKSGATYVAYLFAHNAGGFGDSGTDNVISCGSFTTDGSANATVNLGYEPQWLMFKKSSGASSWIMVDNMRGWPVGTGDAFLYADLSSAESNITFADYISPTATGFQANALDPGSGTYIYIAIRRGPMKTPESGTEVFSPNLTAASTGNAITTNFPVDLQIQGVRPNYGLSVSNAFLDRLRGISSNSTEVGYFLAATSTNAENTGNTLFRTLGWGNTGYNQDGYLSGTGAGIYWNFRRAPGFFDVVCYTGTGSATTVTHNLGVAPELMIVKRRDSSTNGAWVVYVASEGATKFLNLSNQQASSASSTIWNNTSPTSSQFTVGTYLSVSSGTYVSYLFSSVSGVSKVGSYTGTGNLLQINCGFTSSARLVLIKRTDSDGAWFVYDSARGIVSGNDPYLLLNSTAAEVTNTDYIDTYSSGFELTSDGSTTINVNNASYIYLAIA